jgi:hypothetical protein
MTEVHKCFRMEWTEVAVHSLSKCHLGLVIECGFHSKGLGYVKTVQYFGLLYEDVQRDWSPALLLRMHYVQTASLLVYMVMSASCMSNCSCETQVSLSMNEAK